MNDKKQSIKKFKYEDDYENNYDNDFERETISFIQQDD